MTLYDVLVASISHLKLIISYRVIDQPFFFMQSYSQAFFSTEISTVILQLCLLFAGSQFTLKLQKERQILPKISER